MLRENWTKPSPVSSCDPPSLQKVTMLGSHSFLYVERRREEWFDKIPNNNLFINDVCAVTNDIVRNTSNIMG